MRTFSRSASLSGLGKFLGPRGIIEEPLRSVKVNGKEVLFYDIHPESPGRLRRIILGYKSSEYRKVGDRVDIDYNDHLSREDQLALLKVFRDINLKFGE